MNCDAPTDGYYEPSQELPDCLQCKYCKAADNLETFFSCEKQQQVLRSVPKCRIDLVIFLTYFHSQKEDEDPICDEFEWSK